MNPESLGSRVTSSEQGSAVWKMGKSTSVQNPVIVSFLLNGRAVTCPKEMERKRQTNPVIRKIHACVIVVWPSRTQVASGKWPHALLQLSAAALDLCLLGRLGVRCEDGLTLGCVFDLFQSPCTEAIAIREKEKWMAERVSHCISCLFALAASYCKLKVTQMYHVEVLEARNPTSASPDQSRRVGRGAFLLQALHRESTSVPIRATRGCQHSLALGLRSHLPAHRVSWPWAFFSNTGICSHERAPQLCFPSIP